MTAILPILHRFAEDLNSTQYAAVTYSSGPLLVTAGPGTGKTLVLTYRVAWLLDQFVPASEILMLTFSNSAAEEMLTRAAKLAGRSAKLFGGTFHSVGCRFLRQYGHHIGLSRFSILDRDDAEGIIAQLRHSSGSAKGLLGKAEILNFISAAANTLRSVEELGASAFISDIAKAYAAYKRQHALLDFDDLLTCWLGLLVESETAREKITAQFQHVLVDEYQDTNPVQEAILRLLAPHGNITAVGDDAQSVYAFRGADAGCIRRFKEDFACAEVALRHNYRSLPPLIAFSNSVMPGKNLYSDKPGGLLPVFHPASDEADEAAFVAARIQLLLADGVPASEIAVLFRSARHADRLDLELTALGIPFDRRGGFKASKSVHVKDALAFFRILIDPQDRLAWTRKDGSLHHDWLPMSDRLRKAMTGHLSLRSGEWVFPNPQTGLPYFERSKWLPKLCRLAGVKEFGLHGIRHLSASILIRAKVSLLDVQTILRHTNLTTTQRYVHRLESVRKAIEVFE